jgi:hypothetical protein
MAKAARDALEEFQKAEREQVLKHQSLEQKVLRELSKAVVDLQGRHRYEQDRLARLTTSADLHQAKAMEEQRQQLEARQQQERDQLAAYIAKQVQTLNDHRSELQVQASQDEKAFQEALYRTQQDADRQHSLRDVLARQQTVRDDLERGAEERLFSAFAQQAFSGRFSDTRALRAVWEKVTEKETRKATPSEQDYNNARGRFWKAVNEGRDDNAKTVRRILEKAGYELQRDANAPLLKMAGWDHSGSHAERVSGMRALRELLKEAQKNQDLTDKDVRARVSRDFLRSVDEGTSDHAKVVKNILEKAGEERSTLELDHRKLSIDHVAAQSLSASERLRSENVRFMSKTDNSSRGNHYNEYDRRNDV